MPTKDQSKVAKLGYNKGANTFKVIAALRMASEKGGITPKQAHKKFPTISVASWNYVLGCLVTANEAIHESDRYYSDVYSEIPSNKLTRTPPISDMTVEEEVNIATKSVAVHAVNTVSKYLDQLALIYPSDVFGPMGAFVNRMVESVKNAIVSEIKKGY